MVTVVILNHNFQKLAVLMTFLAHDDLCEAYDEHKLCGSSAVLWYYCNIKK